MDFRAFIAPVEPDTFLANHWRRAPPFVSGQSARFADLGFDLPALRAGLSETRATVALKAQFFDTAGEHRAMPIATSQIEPCFSAGMTVCFGPVQDVLPSMGESIRDLARSSGFAGSLQVMCYWSPRGGGFGWHYDEVGLFICQIAGSKRWWFSKAPAVESAESPFVYTESGAAALLARGIDVGRPPEDAAAETVELRPGDVLYLPAGVWHRTAATDAESIALTVGTTGGTAADLLMRNLGAWLQRDSRWMRPLPLGGPDDPASEGTAPHSNAELSARLADLKAFVGQLTTADLTRA